MINPVALRKVWVSEYSSIKTLLLYKFVYYNTKIINKMGEHLKIIEYPVWRYGYSSIREKLPNSGDTLELQVPSYSWKAISGWSNDSCKVTSQKKNAGNRGSKSGINTVKEQRVYGSWPDNKLSGLRYTLTGFERNRWTSYPSNQIINKRLYSTDISALEKPSTVIRKSSINPWFITGFVDGDASFSVSISKKSTGIGWKIQPLFHIGLDSKDLALLRETQKFFNV